MTTRRLVVLATLAALSSVPAASRAEAPPADVQVLVDRATEAFRAGDWRTALEGFEEALARSGDGRLHYMIGRSLDALGRRREAVVAFERFLATDGPPEARERALVEVKRLRDLLSRATLRVEVRPSGSRVFVEGTFTGAGPVVEHVRTPGTVRVRAEAPRHRAEESAVELTGGEVVKVRLTLEEDPVLVRAARRRSWGLGLLAAGAAFLGAGSAAMLASSSARSEVRDAGATPHEVLGEDVLVSAMSDARARELLARGDRYEIAGTVVLSVGSALVLAGLFTFPFFARTGDGGAAEAGIAPGIVADRDGARIVWGASW